jgi:hypothetical protein
VEKPGQMPECLTQRKKSYIPALQFFYLDEMHLAMSGKRLDPPERVLKPNGTTLEGRVNTTVRLTDIS